MKTILRIGAGLGLLLGLAACGVGLLACLEPMAAATRATGMGIYTAGVALCLWGLRRVITSRPGETASAVLPLTAAALVAGASSANAAGLLVADGGLGGNLDLTEHSVEVMVNNGVAVTEVTQVFKNLENRQVEALYTFPVPKGASVSNFSMWINGKEMTGEVVEKERARQIYDSYKQVKRDPGLLEQKDFKTFEMRIFPIGPQADQRVQITYCQELDQDHDRATYVYPLQTTTRGVQSKVKGKFAFTLRAKSEVPLTGVSSPSHGAEFVTSTHGEHACLASLESREGDLSRDIVIGLAYGKPVSGIDLISSREGGDDGFFLMQFTVGDDLEALDTGMDYVFLLDVSGSMADDRKLALSKDSIAAFMETLGEKDRIELLTFNVEPHPLLRELRAFSEPVRAGIRAHLDTQIARGGTVLAPALRVAYKYADADRPLNVVIISDGMTDPGERAELVRLIQERPRSARVFCVGVGNEVNKPVLDQLTRISGGLAAFLSPGDDLRRAAGAFRRKLAHPAVADLRLKVEGVELADLEPAELPNVFHGAPLRVYGRTRGDGEARITLSGTVQGRERAWSRTVNIPARSLDNPEIERMWAQKRIARLDELGGPQAREEMVRLGEAFSVVSQHTSFLVLENDAEYQRWKIDRRNALRTGRDRAAQARVRQELDRLRDEALAGLGPQPASTAKAAPLPSAPQALAPQAVAPTIAGNHPAPSPRRSPDMDFGWSGGSGPVGPLFLVALAWLRRARGRQD